MESALQESMSAASIDLKIRYAYSPSCNHCIGSLRTGTEDAETLYSYNDNARNQDHPVDTLQRPRVHSRMQGRGMSEAGHGRMRLRSVTRESSLQPKRRRWEPMGLAL